MQDAFTLIINAGGASRRMGQTKALLPVPPAGRPLLAHLVERLQVLSPAATVIIANDPAIPQRAELGASVRWLPDRYGAIGPLGGIATGLDASTGWALIVACDLPLLNPTVLAALLAVAWQTEGEGAWDAVVPVVAGRPEPLHALYHARCLPAALARIERGERRASAFLADVRVRYVAEAELRQWDPALRSFTNVNRPAEWAEILPQVIALAKAD